jgi:hypothetical protein
MYLWTFSWKAFELLIWVQSVIDAINVCETPLLRVCPTKNYNINELVPKTYLDVSI